MKPRQYLSSRNFGILLCQDLLGLNNNIGWRFFYTDHGTAFGKAGEGGVDPESTIRAIKVAVQLTLNK